MSAMDQESIVYGCIRNQPGDESARELQYRANLDALASLPSEDGFPLLAREMFGSSGLDPFSGTYHTQVIHFGASYRAVEYEWEQWLARFEALLAKMHWVSATVHLQTELSGNHVFHYAPRSGVHRPGDAPLEVRCEWEHDLVFRIDRRV